MMQKTFWTRVMLSKNEPVSDWVTTALLHLVVTFIITFPSILSFHSHFIGGPRGDKFQFIWNFWWVKHALFNLHRLPFYCDIQYYPTGVSLALHDMAYFWTALSIPLQYFLDPRIILNLFLILCFPLNGLAFYRLAREITKDHRGAIAGSLIFAYSPYLIGRFHVCHIQYLGVFFIPLFILELWRYHHSPRTIFLIKAGIYLSLTSLISYYYGVALTLILLSFLFYQTISSKTRWADPRYWRKIVFQILIMIALIGSIMSPFVIPTLIQLNRGDYQLKQEPLNNLEENSGDLVAYFVPDATIIATWKGWFLFERGIQWARKINASLSGNKLEKSVYPGWISWITIGMALGLRNFRKRNWPWILLSIFFWIFTLGPTLFVAGKPYLQGLLPWGIFTMIPVLNIIRGPTRFACFITLGTGMLLAAGIALLKEKYNPRVYKTATILITILIIIEFLPLPTSLTANNVFLSKFYRDLQNDQRNFSILNIPTDFTGATGGGDIYVYTQTIHQKPIIGGHVSREPEYALKTLHESAFLQAVALQMDKGDPQSPFNNDGVTDMPETLRRLKVGYIIVHKSLLTENEFRRVVMLLEQGIGSHIFEDQWIRVYSASESSFKT